MDVQMPKNSSGDLARAFSLIPSGVFVVTSAHDDGRGAAVVRWVQPCSTHPPMVVIAMPLGQSVEPFIRNSHRFALCQISARDRLIERTLSEPAAPTEDPLISLATQTSPSGSPVIDRSVCYFDCELVRHIDIEADCALFVGLIHYARVLTDETPALNFGVNGVNGH
jgi:flavin reductase